MTDDELLLSLGARAREREAEQPLEPAAVEAMALAVERRFGDELRGSPPAPDAEQREEPARQKPRRWPVVLGVLAPLAAGVALLTGPFSPRPNTGPAPQYRIEVERVAREDRAPAAAAGKVLRVQHHVAPRFVIRPNTATSERPRVSVVVRPRAAADMRQPWPHRVEYDASGVLRVTLERPESLPARGALSVEVSRGAADPAHFDFEFVAASE
jgi:hypothetical protein